jgi:putative alpha-1,2-mannosidase
MSSLGLYQVCPGCSREYQYTLTLPQFNQIQINIAQNIQNRNSNLTQLLIIKVFNRLNYKTDIYIKKIDDLTAAKEADLMTV